MICSFRKSILHPTNFLHSVSPPRFPWRVMINYFEPSPSPQPITISSFLDFLENALYPESAVTFLPLSLPACSNRAALPVSSTNRPAVAAGLRGHAEESWITLWLPLTLNQEVGILKQLLSTLDLNPGTTLTFPKLPWSRRNPPRFAAWTLPFQASSLTWVISLTSTA